MHAAADAGIFALRVLAHDDPVELLVFHVAQRRRYAGQDARRPYIGVLVERLADGEPQSPQRDVIWNVRVTRRAEEDGIVVADVVAAVLRHHAAMLLVVFAAPVEMVELEAEAAVAFRDGVHRLDAGGDHFGTDAVARDG